MKGWEISSLLSFPKKNQRNAVSKTKTWSQPNYGIQRLALRTGPWNRPSIWVHLHTILSGIKRWIRRNHQILCSTSKYPHFLVAKKKLWFLQPETLKPIPPNRKNPWKPLKHEKKQTKNIKHGWDMVKNSPPSDLPNEIFPRRASTCACNWSIMFWAPSCFGEVWRSVRWPQPPWWTVVDARCCLRVIFCWWFFWGGNPDLKRKRTW